MMFDECVLLCLLLLCTKKGCFSGLMISCYVMRFATLFREPEVVTCYLHGQCAVETLRAYECLTEPEDMFVIIQFVHPSFVVNRTRG